MEQGLEMQNEFKPMVVFMRRYFICLFIGTFLLLTFFPGYAMAACASPAGAAGDMIYNQANRVLQWCDGTAWYAAGQINPAGPNDGCLGPVGVGGDIIYNQTEHILQYCDGDHWQGVAGGVDKAPDGFTFVDLINQTQSTQVTSNIVTILGIAATTDVTISGQGTPEFRIAGGPWVTSGIINNGQTLQLRLTTNAALSTTNTATVVVGTVEGSWGVSTVGADTVPNAFSFTDRTGVAKNTLITSNSITITGVNASTPVSVSGGGTPLISINGGAWVTGGNISNGQTLQVRLTSSSSDLTTLTATINVGGVTDSWTVQTVAIDPNWSSVIFMAKFDGTDGSTSISDSSSTPKSITRNGNAQIDTAQSQSNGASLLLDGNGDWLNVPSSDFDMLGANFTAEGWFRFNSVALTPHLMEWGSALYYRAVVYVKANKLYFYTANGNGSQGDRIASSTTLSTNTWYHIALVRSGTVFTLYLNGVSQGTSTSPALPATPTTMHIGWQAFGNTIADDYLNGWVDEFRVTKGVARYTAGFTPPTPPFPNQ
jgi:hypothetical protein